MQSAATSSAVRWTPARWPGPIASIALAQLFGTSLWFSANGVGPSLMREWGATAADIGWLTSSVQVGFILGTLLMSVVGIADRFQASTMFVLAGVSGAVFNACFAWFSSGVLDACIYRFMVGLCLAGIYPIGMKMLVTWVKNRPGWALSLLVGMLTLGTALPHALTWGGAGLDWRVIASASSAMTLVGVALVWLLGDGPHAVSGLPVSGKGISGWARIIAAFRIPAYRAAAFGYFGHMWELYAFWTVLPLLLAGIGIAETGAEGTTSALAFVIIAAGTIGCILGGLISKRVGSAYVAGFALALSGLTGAIFLIGWRYLPHGMLLALLIVWGASVIADSPHFSALSAKACSPDSVGTALAVQNSIGFAITIVSISLVTTLIGHVGVDGAWILVVGPIAGLWLFRPALAKATPQAPSPAIKPD